jgi:hypothetical protein
VVVGDRDPFVPVDHAWGLARQLSDARLFVAPECGHEVMVRRPALFNEACAGFYRSTEAVARRRAAAFKRDPGPVRAGTGPTSAPGHRLARQSTGRGYCRHRREER